MQSNSNNWNNGQFNNGSSLNQGQWNNGSSLNQGQWNQPGLNTYTSTSSLNPPTIERVMLPTQVIEKPAAVHEEIRKELVEEIQPVINVEKVKTEVHQVTQPLFDKEVRPVQIENRTLATENLPELFVQGRGARAADDFSTTRLLDTQSRLIEKPAIINEVDRTQIIEEIQPVVYKETIVPSVIQETKPVFQKIVEGPVYSQQTLPVKSLADWNGSHNLQNNFATRELPLSEPVLAPAAPILAPAAPIEKIVIDIPKEPLGTTIIDETITTTTTTMSSAYVAPQVGGRRHLFHKNKNTNTKQDFNNATYNPGPVLLPTSYPASAPVLNSSLGGTSNLGRGLPNATTEHFHQERTGPANSKVIEDTTVIRSHQEAVLPARLI